METEKSKNKYSIFFTDKIFFAVLIPLIVAKIALIVSAETGVLNKTSLINTLLDTSLLVLLTLPLIVNTVYLLRGK